MPLTLPEPFQALIFDCDGTLVDTAPAHFHALQQALALQGQSMEHAWYFDRLGLTPHDLLNQHESHIRSLGHASPALDRAAYYSVYDRFYQAGLAHLREQTIVADLARLWHGRVPMAVASNGHQLNVEASLRSTGLLALFDHIVSADDVPRGKPAPDVFLAAAHRLGVPAAGCIVLEDSDEGLAAAAAAGMRSVDVRPHLLPESSLASSNSSSMLP